MPSAGFEPAIPATKWPKTYALDREVTGIGINNNIPNIVGMGVEEAVRGLEGISLADRCILTKLE
jgi:hypothetical protein